MMTVFGIRSNQLNCCRHWVGRVYGLSCFDQTIVDVICAELGYHADKMDI
jgi:hypothetical protein